MTKKQEQMMICPKAKGCTEPFKDECAHVRLHHKVTEPIYAACDETCFYEGCTCIPVEPEPHIKHPEHQEGSRQHVISYSTQGRHCSEPNCEINFEPEPTCPECGHTIASHCKAGCCAEGIAGAFCDCLKSPADLQSKHCTGCLNPSDNYNCVSKEDCPEQPTPTMPLIWPQTLFNKAGEVVKSAQEQQRDADMAWLPAHDSAIASKAVKEFADKCIKEIPDPLYLEHWEVCDQLIAHIRALAGGKE